MKRTDKTIVPFLLLLLVASESAAQYAPLGSHNAAVQHLTTGEKFTFKAKGRKGARVGYVTRTGADSFTFTFTSASKSGKRIFTHWYGLTARELQRTSGITLPEGF